MDVILFDMDGVLIDVSGSYHRTARETAGFFLKRRVSEAEILDYKQRGGLNNDWDLVERLLCDRGIRIEREMLVRVFQAAYRGRSWNGNIRFERWLAEQGLLEDLSAHARLGIVTGRPREEALYALDRFQSSDLFETVVVMEDLPPDRGKPFPGGILLALSRLGGGRAVYLGDTVDDMRAARGAGIRPVGVRAPGCPPAGGRRRLIEAGAETVLGSVNQIREVLDVS
jgi:HAD superfamily phosphatase